MEQYDSDVLSLDFLISLKSTVFDMSLFAECVFLEQSLLEYTHPPTKGVATTTSYQQLIPRIQKLREGRGKYLTSYAS